MQVVNAHLLCKYEVILYYMVLVAGKNHWLDSLLNIMTIIKYITVIYLTIIKIFGHEIVLGKINLYISLKGNNAR